MSNSWRIGAGAACVLAVALFFAVQFQMARSQAERAARAQKYIDRSIKLLGDIVPSSASPLIATSQSRWRSPYRPSYSGLSVQMASCNDQDPAVFDWNLDTGELMHLSIPRHAQRTMPSLTRCQAAVIARSWLARLGIAAQSPKWRLAADPEEQAGRTYPTSWIAPDREVDIVVESRTGALIYAGVAFPHRFR